MVAERGHTGRSVYGPRNGVRAELWCTGRSMYEPRYGCTAREMVYVRAEIMALESRIGCTCIKIYTRRIATVFNIYRIITRHGRAAIEVSI